MYSQGVDPKLDFSDLPTAVAVYEKLTSMKVPPRSPYGGKLVFTAFSGSHQDAIAKGFRYRKEKSPKYWDIPYLPIDPKDIGRDYEGDVIRINSQSGKGGVGYLLETKYGFCIPKAMREDCGYAVKRESDKFKRELSSDEVFGVFEKNYINIASPLALVSHSFEKADGITKVKLCLQNEGKSVTLEGSGNGQLDAAANALKKYLNKDFSTLMYNEHALDSGSGSRAAAYVAIADTDGKNPRFACGVDTDIMRASIKALLGAVNKL